MTDPDEGADLAAEVEALRAERDVLALETASLDRPIRGGRGRRVGVTVLVIVASISFLAASIGYWANGNLLRGDSPTKAVRVSYGKIAISAIPAATHAKAHSDFGSITVYDGDALSISQQALKAFDKLMPLLILLTIVLSAATLVLSRPRRRTSMQLLFGFALAMVLIRRVVNLSVTDVVDLAKIPGNKEALQSILNAFTDPLLAATSWILTAFVAVLVMQWAGYEYWLSRLRELGGAGSGAAIVKPT